jgi:hypothetical protein
MGYHLDITGDLHGRPSKWMPNRHCTGDILRLHQKSTDLEYVDAAMCPQLKQAAYFRRGNCPAFFFTFFSFRA